MIASSTSAKSASASRAPAAARHGAGKAETVPPPVAPRETFGLIEVIGRLKKACRDAGSQKAWAKRHGLSLGYVNDVICSRIAPGDAILAALGLAKVTKYVELRKVNG